MRLLVALLAAVTVVTITTQQKLARETCDSRRRFATVQSDADVWLVGLFPIRHEGLNGYGCGNIRSDFFGVLTYEAARFAVERINSVNFIPGVKLGLKAYDSCSNPSVAVAALDDFFQESSGWQCSVNASQLVLGAVGGLYSRVTGKMAKYLEYSSIPVISYLSNAADLSDKSLYPNLFRTSASSEDITKVLVATLNALKWTHVGIIYTDELYGQSLFSLVKKASELGGICVAEGVAIPVGSSVSTDELASRLQKLVDSGVQAILLTVVSDISRVLQTLERILPPNSNMQFIASNPIVPSSRLFTGAIQVLHRNTETPVDDGFIEHMSSLDPRRPPPEDPWFQEWYMRKFRCRLTGVRLPGFNNAPVCNVPAQRQRRTSYLSHRKQSAYIEVIEAVYAYAAALKQARIDLCRGQTRGICPALATLSHEDFLSRYLKEVVYTFRPGDGIPSLSGLVLSFDDSLELRREHYFEINNYNQRQGQLSSKQVGNYSNAGLQLDMTSITVYDRNGFRPLPSIPELGCSGEQCGQCLSSGDLRYWYTPGDVVIVGMANIHQSGSSPGTCGIVDIKNSFRALAFQAAMTPPSNQNPSPSLTIGSLLVDVCSSEARIINFIDQFFSGTLQLKDKSGTPIRADSVVAAVDMLDESMALSVAQYSKQIGLPVAGSVASNVDLGKKTVFPYYTQIVPSDNKQALAMAFFLQKMNWTYIQAVYSGDTFGRLGITALKQAADSVSVCIAQSLEIGLDGDALTVVRSLRSRPNAKVVLFFGSPGSTLELFQAIKDANVKGQYIIVTTAWEDEQLPEDLQDVAAGTFTVQLSGPSDEVFDGYLKGLNPRLEERIYVRELYQRTFNCDLNSVNKPCDTTLGLQDSPLYDEKTKFSVKLVSESARLLREGVSNAYNGICSNETGGRCQEFPSVSKLRQATKRSLDNTEDENRGNYEIIGYRLTTNQTSTKVAVYSGHSLDMLVQPETIRSNLGVAASFVSSCQGFCGHCSYLVHSHPYIHQPGDITIGSLIGITRTVKNQFECQRWNLGNGYQHAAAMMFVLNQINSGTGPVRLNNVTLGNLILDDCNSDSRSIGLLNEIYSGVVPVPVPGTLSSAPLNGWLTHTQSDNFNIASTLRSFQSPVVASRSASLEESEISKSPMLFTTGPIFNERAVSIARVVRSLGYSYFQAFVAPDLQGRRALAILESVAREEGVCIANTVEISGNILQKIEALADNRAKAIVILADSLKYGQLLQEAISQFPRSRELLFFTTEPMRYGGKPISPNVISLYAQPRDLDDFRTYLNSRSLGSDGFIGYYYQSVFKCDLSGSSAYQNTCANISSLNIPVDITVQYTILASYALGSAIHQTLQEKCGVDYNGVCTAFSTSRDTNQRIVANLAMVSFQDPWGEKFAFTGRRANQNVDVLLDSSAAPIKIGSYTDGRLTISRRDLLQRLSDIESTCRQPCLQCKPQSFFDYVQGDIYLAGIFDIHYKSVAPFSCGKIKTIHGYQSLEAFKYALNRVNRHEGQFAGILNGVKLGGIGLDACDSAVRTGYLAANIHNGKAKLSKNGTNISPDNIVAYIGVRESGNSRHLARILNTLKIPQISYGSTSLELADQTKYPYFARTVPVDDKQSDAILDFLDKYNLRYVQILSSPTTYGELASKVFLDKASSKRICISQTVTFADEGFITKESATDAVTALLDRPTANVVIVFADIGYINGFLHAIKRNEAAKGKFFFVGTVSWGINEVVLEGVEDVAYGSVVFNVEKIDISRFDNYLAAKTLVTERDNKWFQEFYEDIHDCYVTLSLENSNGNRRDQCRKGHLQITTANRYLQDPNLLHVMNAVYSAAYGLDEALKSVCGENYTEICRRFRENDNWRDLAFEGALRARFQDEALSDFNYTNRAGNKGYMLYWIQPSSVRRTYVYSDIGRFNDGRLQVTDFQTSWEGGCDRTETCNECPAIRDQIKRHHSWMPPGRGLNTNIKYPMIVAIFDLHGAQEGDEFRCGVMKHDSVFDNVLAFMFTLQSLVNPVKDGIEIGGLILDTCSRSARLYPDLLSLAKGPGSCSVSGDSLSQHDLSNIVGAVSYGEENTLVSNRILAPLSLTLVSPNAVSPALSDTEKYPYFLRTKPPYDVEGQAILDLLRSLGWTYITVVYSNDKRGQTIDDYLLGNALGDGSQEQAICIGRNLMLAETADPSIANDYVRILDQQVDRGSRVVVFLTSPAHSELMLGAVRDVQSEHKFVSIGLHNWGLGQDEFSTFGDYLLHGISLRTLAPQVPKFAEYQSSLKYSERQGLPSDLFEEYFQHVHQCFLPDSRVSQRPLYEIPCDENASMNSGSRRHDPDVFHTIIATYTIAMGINKLLDSCQFSSFEDCRDQVGSRNDIFQGVWDYRWPDILETLGISQSEIEDFQYLYTAGRYGNTGYMVYSVVSGPDGQSPTYQKIGRWNGTIQLDKEAYYSGMDGKTIESTCYGRLSCSCQFLGGKTGALTGVDKWGEAVLIPRNYYLLESLTATNGSTYYQRRIEWPLWAVIIAVLTCIMILVTLFVFVVLLFFYPIRHGTTVLGFLLLLGILGIFLINFAFFVPASAASCGARRFVMGVVYAICFAALLVKAIDNWRYKWDDYDSGKRKYKGVTSACSLLLIALALVAIQVLIAIVWLVMTAPGATLVSTVPPPHDYWWCNPPLLYDIGLVLSFIFVILLLLATIIFAVVSFLKDINYFESRWVLAACLCTAAIFLAWMIISTMAPAPYRDVTIAIANLLNGTILLIFFPVRKALLMFVFKDKTYDNGSKSFMKEDYASQHSQHMEMRDTSKAMDRSMIHDRPMIHDRSMLQERSGMAAGTMMHDRSLIQERSGAAAADQSFVHSSGAQSLIYSQPRNAYDSSAVNRSVLSDSAYAGNLRQTVAAPSTSEFRSERHTTTMTRNVDESDFHEGGVSVKVDRPEDPGPIIITELVGPKVERRLDDNFIRLQPKPYIYEEEVRTTRTYKDVPDNHVPTNLSSSYEVDEVSDPNTHTQKLRLETIPGEPMKLPIHHKASKASSSSSNSSFTSSRLPPPIVRAMESDIMLGAPLMELDPDKDLLLGIDKPDKEGQVDRQTKKSTIVETDDRGSTKQTTTVETTTYYEY